MSEIGSKQNPTPNNTGAEIAPMVIADLEGRKMVGEEKYGQVLRVENGRDALLDLYQELLDAVLYIRQRIEQENAKLTRQEEALRGIRDMSLESDSSGEFQIYAYGRAEEALADAGEVS